MKDREMKGGECYRKLVHRGYRYFYSNILNVRKFLLPIRDISMEQFFLFHLPFVFNLEED